MSTAKGTPARKRAAKKARSASVVGSAKDKLALMALSPYRFPMDMKQIAMNSARIGGFAFVVILMVGVYYYLEARVVNLMEYAAQTANVSGAIGARAPQAALPVSPVEFFYASNPNGGNYTIAVRVRDAERIVLYAYETSTGQYHTLGDATQTSSDSWRYEWDTAGFSAGAYWIKAVIETRDGIYDRSDSRFLEVK